MVVTTADPHAFSNPTHLAARHLTQFPNLTLDHRYGLSGTHSSLPFTSQPVFTAGVITYSTMYLLTPNVLDFSLLLLYVIRFLERQEAVEVPYGDDALDSGVRDGRGEDTWDARA